jgi:hypothetical protein
MRPKLQKIVVHNYIVRFQDEQYILCLNTFLHDSISSVVDFTKNYTLQEFNEIQEMH